MSSPTFKNIALLGATGNLGSRILTALAGAGFNVTAVQRAGSTNLVPGGTKSVKVDLSSEQDLTSALLGQDVVVSAEPNPRLSSSKIWMDAAIAAGVKRIVPSEYSTNMETKLSQELPIIKDKLEIRRHVERLAADGRIEWTSVNNGPFLVDFIWTKGWMGPSAADMTATYHDGGNNIVCTTSLERIAEGVAHALSPKHAAATRNKPVYIHSAPMSERKMTSIIAKLRNVNAADFAAQESSIAGTTAFAFEAYKKGDLSKMGAFYIPFCFGDGYGGDFRTISWNERFGLKEMDDQELEDVVKRWLD